MSDPSHFRRHRRLRQSDSIRKLVSETTLHTNDLIYPLFVVEGENIKKEIPSMPGVYHLSLDLLRNEINDIAALGIKAIMLFGVPQRKDEVGSEAYNPEGIVQRAIRLVKEAEPQLTVIADTCLCQYTDHGHCGIIKEGIIVNDESLTLHAKTAVSQAKAGADIIAPSSMIDGFVLAIRNSLDEEGFQHVPIMAYSVKYASAYYGPFRDAAGSAPQFGDRKTYQMDPANRIEAIREAESDIEEGADFIMVKPSLSFMDVIRELKDTFPYPVVAYNVSGEYSMVKVAAQSGLFDEKEIVLETLTSLKRSGADLIITYHAKDIARWLREG